MLQIGFRDFNVIPENIIEADFQGGDAGAAALAGFDVCDVLFAVLAQVAEFIQFGIIAGPDSHTVAHLQRRGVRQGIDDGP